MNPPSPREELEIRITALLMGELSPDEAAALHTQIAADAELTALHARLGHALGLLREACAIPEQPAPPVPARFSDERRARLLAHFQGVKPGPVIVKPRRDWKWAVPLGLAASLIALIGGAVFVNGFALRKGSLSANAPSRVRAKNAWLAWYERNVGAKAADFSDPYGDGFTTLEEFRSKDLAESAESTVMSQIRKATHEKDGSGRAWSSQPGMIRVAPSGEGGRGSSEANRFYHLYGSVDELHSASKETQQIQPKGGAAASTENASNASGVSAAEIDRARFFLSAHSRSPELNLFGRPRVTVWPGTGAVYLPSVAENPGDVATSEPRSSNGMVAANPATNGKASTSPDKSVPGGEPASFAGSFWDTPRVQTYFDRGMSGDVSSFRGGLAASQPTANESQRYPSETGGRGRDGTGNQFQNRPVHPEPVAGDVSKSPKTAADVFAMNVAEPNTLSEPFSTDGKVNLNHALAPFSYIQSPKGGAVIADPESAAQAQAQWKKKLQFAAVPPAVAGAAPGSGEASGIAAPAPPDGPMAKDLKAWGENAKAQMAANDISRGGVSRPRVKTEAESAKEPGGSESLSRVAGGDLEFPKSQPGGAGLPALADTGTKASTLDLNGNSSIVIDSSISGTGTAGLIKSGSGTLTLSGAGTYTGGTTISGGTLRIENAGVPGRGASLEGRYGREADPAAPGKPANEDNFAHSKTDGESRVTLGTASRGISAAKESGLKDVSGPDGRKPANPDKPATTSLGLVLNDLSDALPQLPARSDEARKNATAGRGEVSEKLDAGHGIKGVKNETDGRRENRAGIAGTAFPMTPSTPAIPAAATAIALGDQSASAASGLWTKDNVGPIRIDYGVPLKETAGSSPGDKKFQFNVGYKFGNETSEDARKAALDPHVAESEGFLSFGGAIAGKPAGTPLPAQPAGSTPLVLNGGVIASSSNTTGVVNAEGTRWVEVTRNGTLVNPAANATDAARRRDDNPVVGRIAFWTDDDTAKVNINTADGTVNVPSREPTLQYFGAGNTDSTFSGVITGAGDVALDKAGDREVQLKGLARYAQRGIVVPSRSDSLNTNSNYNVFTGGGTSGTGRTFTINGGASLNMPAVNNTLNSLSFGDTSTAGATSGGIITKSGERANGEVKREFNAPAESPAPELPKITGASGAGTEQLRDSSTQAVAERELARRLQRETAGRNETAAGQAALKKKDYESAFAHFKNASESIPAGAPNVAESRQKAEEGIAAAGVKLAEQRATEGYYASAVQTLQEVLKQQPDSPKALGLLSKIEAPDYFNKQITPEHRAKVEQVKEAMVAAKGYTDLGRYDLATRKYDEVLSKDPYNDAAQKGREEIANLKDRSARAAYNTSRAISMTEVAQAWARPLRRFDRKANEGKDDAAKRGPASPDELNVRTDSSKNAFVAKRSDGGLADFDTGIGNFPDGAFAGKADLGNFDSLSPSSVIGKPAGGDVEANAPLDTYFSPNRQIPSPVMFGSLLAPSNGAGWETQLFSPNPAAGAAVQPLATVDAEAAAKKADAKKAAKEMEIEKVAEQAPPAPKPAPSALEPQPEIRTGANAFSTFSLNVSDVAFKLAGASLEHGTMPDVSTLRSEEFINAFDYRDPEPAAGAPLGFVSERARYPFAQNRDLLRLSVKTAAAGRQPGRPLNIVLLLDNSGSMERADRVRIVREAMRVLSAQLTPQDKLSIVTFARTPRLWADGVSGDKAGEVTARVGEITPEGGTNLAAALDLGYTTALRHYQAGSINHVVVLTDGAANLGDVDPAALKQKVEAHRKQGVALDCFGIGWEGLNDDMLEQLSRNGDGRYGFINTPEEAATNFAGQLAGALRVAASDVKVQVEWNPRRVTAYRQVGYAKHQLTKEQFRDNTVDAAEIGAAESGNALYVVEVNPRGEGDLATVRVRFKVPGTSDYREHEWTVPFTGNAAPLEQSSSTLRLAATASAFSEMLAASPYATEVTSDRLLSLLNGVPAIYNADPRPKKLEWMIRQAKSISGR